MMKPRRNEKRRSRDEHTERYCFFCVERKVPVDYKDPRALKRFISPYARILPPSRTGACTRHQREIAQAIKRARFVGLTPFVQL